MNANCNICTQSGQWFDASQGDRKIVRDIAAQNKDGQAVLPIVKYQLVVRTGSKKGSGSDANFSAILYGANGDSGLLKLDGARNAFEVGRVDEVQ